MYAVYMIVYKPKPLLDAQLKFLSPKIDLYSMEGIISRGFLANRQPPLPPPNEKTRHSRRNHMAYTQWYTLVVLGKRLMTTSSRGIYKYAELNHTMAYLTTEPRVGMILGSRFLTTVRVISVWIVWTGSDCVVAAAATPLSLATTVPVAARLIA